ncbi:uncharacterized protein PRCAT00004828001 [Priceomyces carsonii]|uniref:uncharacterized protein n=1 Tax=Priceomyces carsonii TaxID=28549 RepID=UPI002ED8578E|nr:unnamed protein product [Priceomyces carsonii]
MSTYSAESTTASSKSNDKRQSLGTIESSVTRLLVSTKHLLESLTQWARQEADDKLVSDAYVKLGNDFRAATKAFAHTGIDISDIGDVPQALRIVLEAALSGPPSQENLDKYLPNIRNIIVTLLQNLKSKQVKAKELSQDRPSKQKSSAIRLPKPVIESPNKPPDSNLSVQEESEYANDALTQLQKGNFILRRASKRFSAYQYAKLANISPNTSMSNNQIKPDVQHQRQTEVNNAKNMPLPLPGKRGSHNDNYIFLRLGSTTKKVDIKLPLTSASIRLLFVEKFAYSPGKTTFPDIYIEDTNTKVSYQLEEHNLDDVTAGSLLILKEEDQHETEAPWKHEIDEKIQKVNEKLDQHHLQLMQELKDALDAFTLKSATSEEKKDKKENTFVNFSNNTYLKELNDIQRELKAIKQVQVSNKAKMKNSVENLLLKVSEFEESNLDITKSSNRTYMEGCHLKLSEDSDTLLTKVDDLQDIMEALRKDVAQRGVRIGEKQLKFTQKEIEEAKDELNQMIRYISKERSVWKKIWEAELDKVCEEQQFFNLQSDLTEDLEEDIKKIEETYDLIEQCSLEQSKHSGIKRNKVVAQLHIPAPGESIHDMKHAVLNEVAALQPDHESRVEAIAKAEKLRSKEKELMQLTKFQEELGDFVEDSRLKKSGGIEELERLRQMKDSENLKNSLGIF